MKKRFTQIPKFIHYSFLLLIFSFTSLLSPKTYAQSFCENETVFWLETFGTGITPSSNPDVIITALTYQENDPLFNEGTYRVANSTQQKPEWQVSADHTPGDINGEMLVANGQAETFYRHTVINSSGFQPASYSASLFLMNINTVGTCGPDALLPTISFDVEFLDQDSNWIELSGSPVTASSVPQTINPTWIQLGGVFTLPAINNFKITTIRLTLTDGTVGGCGNDFALDDIKFALCPSGAPLPVTFLSLTARQKGSGINVEWATSSEINSKSFDVEQSNNGNSSWHTISSLAGKGNGTSIKTYSIYDARPAMGINFYRIRQIDKDNVVKYSNTVSVKISLDKTGVTVLSNPFYNTITIDFLSKKSQTVSAVLLDITGRQIASEKWNISEGSTRKEFSNVSKLEKGVYHLSVSDENGNILLSNKLIKQ